MREYYGSQELLILRWQSMYIQILFPRALAEMAELQIYSFLLLPNMALRS